MYEGRTTTVGTRHNHERDQARLDRGNRTHLAIRKRTRLPRVKSRCDMGAGCDEYGACYASAMGQAWLCPRDPYALAFLVIALRIRRMRRG